MLFRKTKAPPAQQRVSRRSELFRERTHARYWWHWIRDTAYVPPVFAALSEQEWSVLDDWFAETERRFENPGEISVPGISMLSGLVGGNGIGAIVQCGHYVGFSTLMLGFLLRSMGKTRCLFSVDIDPVATEFTADWVRRAGLQDQVHLHVGTSADPALPDLAKEYFGRGPQLVLVDSSHQYAHTLEELDLWYAALERGGLLLLHDVSKFAQAFDSTGQGGVMRALLEWAQCNGTSPFLLNSFCDGTQKLDDLTYRDGCGFGLVQK